MDINKCDVCKNETNVLYDRDIVTRAAIINGDTYLKKDKLHICMKCVLSLNENIGMCELGWYEDNVKDDSEAPDSGSDKESNGNVEQNCGDAKGLIIGD